MIIDCNAAEPPTHYSACLYVNDWVYLTIIIQVISTNTCTQVLIQTWIHKPAGAEN